jgi:hypothetical protein
MRRIKSLRGIHVALTGTCSLPRAELSRQIAKRGGKISGKRAWVDSSTQLLVRGKSPSWKHGSFGTKEAQAAKLIRSGSDLAVILSADLEQLLEGHSVWEYPFIAGVEVEELRNEAELEDLRSGNTAARRRFRGPLDATTTISRRLEQAALREHHFGGRGVVPCSLCGRQLPTSLLVIGHIKPRARCSATEKRDFSNVAMPVCVLGCDHLFERGFVTVSSTGRVVSTRRYGRSKGLSAVLSGLSGRRCLAQTPTSEVYFAWHREFAFQGGGA